jgi:hypothetical protein
VYQPGWCLARELADGVGDAAPRRGAIVIVLGEKFISACGTFLGAFAS